MLVAALVGPFLVDWTAYRATFEQHAERMFGHKVRVLGDADASILPIPSLTFSDVRVGEAEDPLMTVEKFAVRIELAPLLQGEIKVIDMRLEKPAVNLSLDETGRLDWMMGFGPGDAARQIEPDSVQLKNVDIRNGSVQLTDARTGELHQLSNINVALDAQSLIGPFKVEGGAQFNAAPVTLSIATGRRRDDGALRIKAELVPADRPISLSMDGDLTDDGAVPTYAGVFAVERIFDEGHPAGAADTPWKADGKFELSSEKLFLKDFKLSHGPQDRPYGLSGTATLTLGDKKRFDVALTSKQIDLDRTLGKGPSDPANIQSAFKALVDGISGLPAPKIDGWVGLSVPAIVIGGGIIQDVQLDAVTDENGWLIDKLQARLPGRTHLRMPFVDKGRGLKHEPGRLQLGGNTVFESEISLTCEQPAAFFAWWQRGREAGSANLEPFAIKGYLSAGTGGIGLSELVATTNNSRIIGSVTWRPASGENRAEVTADLEANRLNVDQIATTIDLLVPRETGADGGRLGLQSNIGVHIVSERLIIGDIAAAGIDVSARLADGDVSINKFELSDLAGAKISAKGSVKDVLSAPDGRLDASIQAKTLTGLVALADRLAPNSSVAQWFKTAAGSMAPIDLKVGFEARGGTEETEADISIGGTAANTKVAIASTFTGRPQDWRDGEVTVDVTLDGRDSVGMLNQLGMGLIAVDDPIPGELRLKAQGRLADNLTVDFYSRAAGVDATIVGALGAPSDGPIWVNVDTRFRTEDIGPLALANGRMVPMLDGAIGVDLSAKMIGEPERFELSDLTGHVAGTSVTGWMTVDVTGPRAKLRGDLKTESLDIGSVAQLNLGANALNPALEGGSSIWPATPFGAPILPDVDVNVRFAAPKMSINGRVIERARLDVETRPGTLSITGLSGETLGGKIKANLRLKRNEGEAVASGNISLSGIALEDVMWRRNDRPVVTGIADLNLDFDGTGRSVSAIVAGLSGRGAFSVREGLLRYVNPRAFSAVMRAVDAGLELEDEKIRSAFEGHLDVGTFTFDRVDGVLAIASGTARARNISVDGDMASAFGSAAIDLDAWRMRGDWTLKVDPGENAVTGAEPQVGLVFEGPLEAPVRRIDIQPFTAFLTLRAFEQEVRRIEIMQADILERERFNRELSRLRQAAARARERQATEPEQGPKVDDPVADPPGDAPADNAGISGDDRAGLPAGDGWNSAPADAPPVDGGAGNAGTIPPIEPVRLSDEPPAALPAYETIEVPPPATDLPPLQTDPDGFAERIRSMIDSDLGTPALPPLDPAVVIGPAVGTSTAPSASSAEDGGVPQPAASSGRIIEIPESGASGEKTAKTKRNRKRRSVVIRRVSPGEDEWLPQPKPKRYQDIKQPGGRILRSPVYSD